MLHRYLPLLMLMAFWPARAEIFRCVAANGELTYAQTPCMDEDSEVSVERTVKSSTADAAGCQFAHRFALATAQEMKSGVASSTLFDRYGGLRSLSRAAVGLISYVYQYRSNGDVSAERVAALSVAKCKAKSFGDVDCGELPAAYTNRFGGCEQIERDGGAVALPLAGNATRRPANADDPRRSRAAARAEHWAARDRQKEKRTTCRKRVRDKIDKVNSQLRAGYSNSQGNRLRNKRRELEQQMRDC